MKFEFVFLAIGIVICVLSLGFIPKNKLFTAQFIFLFVSLPTWILGLTAVELGLIEYPYRELSTVNRTSFIFEHFVLPIMCIHFNIRFPERSSKTVKLMYYLAITFVFTVIEYFTEKYTLILRYTGWKIQWTFISVCFVFWLSRKTTQWFFKAL